MAASRRGTATKNAFLSGVPTSIPPKTHCSRTRRPTLYLRRQNRLSSISTTMPGPPTTTGFARESARHKCLGRSSSNPPVCDCSCRARGAAYRRTRCRAPTDTPARLRCHLSAAPSGVAGTACTDCGGEGDQSAKQNTTALSILRMFYGP